MSAIKILHIGKYYHPYVGGIEKNVKDIAEGLMSEYVIDVLVCNTGHKSEINFIDGVKIIRCGQLLTIASTPISIGAYFMLKRMLSKYDIIHLHMQNPLMALYLWLLSKKMKGKLILTWHSDIEKQKMLGWFIEPLQRWIIRRSDKIICTTKLSVERSKSLFPYIAKTEVIHLGYRQSEIEYSEDYHILNSKEWGKYAILVGRLVESKNVKFLIGIADDLDLDHVLIIGDGPQKKMLQRQINKKYLHEKVILLGKLPRSTTLELMKNARCFLLPALYEAFGIVILESFALGVPVIASNAIGPEELIDSGIDGYIIPLSKDAEWKQCINKLILDDETKKMMGDNGKMKALKEYKIETMLQQVSSIYRKCLADANA
jgi:rhamnosyl/mannosyltransferase